MSDNFSVDEVNILIDIVFEHSKSLDEIGFEDNNYLSKLEVLWAKLLRMESKGKKDV
jgi:hypothetical protein